MIALFDRLKQEYADSVEEVERYARRCYLGIPRHNGCVPGLARGRARQLRRPGPNSRRHRGGGPAARHAPRGSVTDAPPTCRAAPWVEPGSVRGPPEYEKVRSVALCDGVHELPSVFGPGPEHLVDLALVALVVATRLPPATVSPHTATAPRRRPYTTPRPGAQGIFGPPATSPPQDTVRLRQVNVERTGGKRGRELQARDTPTGITTRSPRWSSPRGPSAPAWPTRGSSSQRVRGPAWPRPDRPRHRPRTAARNGQTAWATSLPVPTTP